MKAIKESLVKNTAKMINHARNLTYKQQKECIYFIYDYGQIFTKDMDKYTAPSEELDNRINSELVFCKKLRKSATYFFFFFNKMKFIQASLYESWVMAVSGSLKDDKAASEICTMIYEWIDEVG
jgi:hypothetical protein